jgi:hypothetical protein
MLKAMKIEDLKLSIIEMILNTEDEQLLRQVALLLKSQEKTVNMMREPMEEYGISTETEVHKLSKEEREAVTEARAQFARGEVLTAEEAEQEIQAWLKD